MDDLVKTCTKCLSTKCVVDFYKAKRGKYGVEAICKDCSKAKYQASKERQLSKAKARYEENKNSPDFIAGRKMRYQANREKILKRRSEQQKLKRASANREELLAAEAAHRVKHRERIRATSKRYHERNRERIVAAARDRWHEEGSARKESQTAWVESNKERVSSYRRKWKEENKHVLASHRKNKRVATPSWNEDEFQELVMREAYSLARLRTDVTGIKWHVDHIVPITSDVVCGLHCAANLRVIPAKINIAKHNKLLEDVPLWQF